MINWTASGKATANLDNLRRQSASIDVAVDNGEGRGFRCTVHVQRRAVDAPWRYVSTQGQSVTAANHAVWSAVESAMSVAVPGSTFEMPELG